MDDIASLVAPIATMIAAMMTAANMGARVTGWGFVVFTIGSVCWTLIGVSTGQTNLLATNSFLTVVNIIGVWRWLGRQARYEEGGLAAAEASKASPAPTLFTATSVAGLPVRSSDDVGLGEAVEALMECETGRINYVVIRSGGVGGVGERLFAVPRRDITFSADGLEISLNRNEIAALPDLRSGEWPAAIG